VVHADHSVEQSLCNGDVPNLQMLTIAGLKDKNEELLARVAHLESERDRLIALNQEQTDRRLNVLHKIVKQRGMDLIKHGQFFIELARTDISLDS